VKRLAYRSAGRTENRCALLLRICGVICWIGVASSKIQMLRPCVARIRSFSRGWTRISCTETFGRFFKFSGIHSLPPLYDANKPSSVPAYSRFLFFGSSRTTCTYAFAGSLPEMFVQDFPESVVLKMYGRKSSNMCRSNATNAVLASVRDGSTCETGEFAARPETFLTRLDQFFPPSVVSCRLPSSVHTQICPF